MQGSKNGALPLLAASLLVSGKTKIEGCPDIADIHTMLSLLKLQGCKVTWENHVIEVDASCIRPVSCQKKLVKAMRSSIMLIAPLVVRCRQAYMMYPGGCRIGERPIDLHIAVLQKMGACFCEKDGEVEVLTNGLIATDICLPFPSVGVTETILMASVLARGVTHVSGAAMEPEIVQLCEFLTSAGAKIEGIGSRELTITGVEALRETSYKVHADRIVAGTYLLGAVATKGKVCVDNILLNELGCLPQVLMRMGASVKGNTKGIIVDACTAECSIPYIKTDVFPGFPTDLQSMLLVCLLTKQGNSVIEEAIFENRFKIVPQLWKMGADVRVRDNRALIRPVSGLRGDALLAQDLRGGAALVLAGLLANTETVVYGDCYIKRGYENIERDLNCLGAQITSFQEKDKETEIE